MLLKAQSTDLYAKDTTHFIDERRHSRIALRLETSAQLGGLVNANVVLHNISLSGLLLETELDLAIRDQLWLKLPHAGSVAAKIMRKDGQMFGCQFTSELHDNELAAVEMAAYELAAYGSSAECESKPMAPAPYRADPAANPERQSFAIPLPQPAANGFAQCFGKLRRKSGLTFEQIANALGVSKPTVWAWEKGKAKPLPERLSAIAQTLGADEAVLIRALQKAGQSGDVIEDCRARIAREYGTNPQNVRIMIEL